jgi:hypothetical protein
MKKLKFGMEEVADIIHNYESALVSKLMNTHAYTHTHPPVPGAEPSCLYCRIHGNVFSKGVQSANVSLLGRYVVPIINVQERTP